MVLTEVRRLCEGDDIASDPEVEKLIEQLFMIITGEQVPQGRQLENFMDEIGAVCKRYQRG